MSSAPPPAGGSAAGVREVRRRAGFSRHERFGLLEVQGPDALAFLESQLPVEILDRPAGSGAITAYLDAKGRITHPLVLSRLPDRILLLTRLPGLDSLEAKLERHHIREDLEIRSRRAETAVWEMHGPAVPELLAGAAGRGMASEPGSLEAFPLAGIPVHFVYHAWTGDPGGHLVLPRARAGDLAAVLGGPDGGFALPEVDEAALEILRIEGGWPEFGIDVDERTLLPEWDRPEMISYRKGCYLGQETLARIHSRGHVNRLLVGLLVEGDHVPEPGTPVLEGDAPVGETRSAAVSPTLGRVVALAMLRARVAPPGTVVHLRMSRDLTAARVAGLPFHRARGPREAADAFYREGLAAFRSDRYEEALRYFERATLLDPQHLDALESAGVSQERLGRMEEAAETMETLTRAAPDHIMAWTNLSRYRAQAGQLEEAERLKGHVSYLVMKRAAGERAARKRAEEDRVQAEDRLRRRVDLFREVLSLDPEDVVANFGLGKTLLDLGRWEEALPHFRKAIERQPSYSMAYNHLGTCLLHLERPGEAAEAWRRGVVEAARRGGLLPLRDMEQKLAGLAGGGPAPSERRPE